MARPKALVHGNAADRLGGSWHPQDLTLTGGCRGRGRSARGLTLVELLVVIVIIGIMASLLVTVASKVSQGGKVTVTEDSLKIADQALNTYVQEKGTIPPPFFEDPRDSTRSRLMPVADARNMAAPPTDRTIINSVGLFIHQAEKDAGMSGLFAGVDSRLLRKHDSDRNEFPDPAVNQMSPRSPLAPDGPPSDPTFLNQPWMPTLMDGFGRPLRYVHPAFGGIITGPTRANPTQPASGRPTNAPDMFPDWIGGGRPYTQFTFTNLRRNNEAIPTAGGNPNPEFLADSDGGRPVGNRPYFYSAGADGIPSTLDDNVYAGGSRPEFDKK